MTTKFFKWLGCFRKKNPSKVDPIVKQNPSSKERRNLIKSTTPIREKMSVKETTTHQILPKKPEQKITTQTLSNPFEVKSPIPSIQNYPEDDNPDWLIGIDNEGDKVKTPPTGNTPSITLTGAVTGNGSLENPVNTTLTAPINAQNNRIINVSSPISNTDAANKSYVDATAGSESIVLQGAVTGSGNLGSPITTIFSSPLNVPLGGGRITGLLEEPYANDEAVNKEAIDTWLATTLGNANAYTDGEIATTQALPITASGDIIGTLKLGETLPLTIGNKNISLSGVITGSGILGGSISTTFTYPIDAGAQKIVNVVGPTVDTDAATKKYVDDNAGGGPADAFASTVILPQTVTYEGSHGSSVYSTFRPATPTETYTYYTRYYADQYFFISRYEHYQAGSARYSMLYSNNQAGGTEWFYTLHTAASQGGASLIRFYTTLDMQGHQIINAPTATEESHVVNLGCLKEHMAKIENRLSILEKGPIPSKGEISFFKKLFKRREK